MNKISLVKEIRKLLGIFMPEVTLPHSTSCNFCNKHLPSFRLAKTSPIFKHGAKIQTQLQTSFQLVGHINFRKTPRGKCKTMHSKSSQDFSVAVTREKQRRAVLTIKFFCAVIQRLNNQIGPILFKLFLRYLFQGLEDNCFKIIHMQTHMLQEAK